MNRHARRALAAIGLKDKKKNTGPWPICKKALTRIIVIEKDFEQDQSIAQLRANSRISEVFECLRPEDIPDEAVYNPKAKAFVLPMEDDPATPDLEAAQAEFEAEQAKQADVEATADPSETPNEDPKLNSEQTE